MFKAINLFALFILCGSVVSVVVAQTRAPQPQMERVPFDQGFAFFDADGGSYLGVQTQEVTKENFGKFGLSGVRGVAIEKVMDDSPAKQAGLQDGDVIVRFNGEEVTSYRKLTRLISETAPDHQAKITVSRGGSEREITVTMGKHPAPKFEQGSFAMAAPAPMGDRVFERTMRIPGVKSSSGVTIREMPMSPGVRIGEMPDGATGNVFVWEGGNDGNFGSTKQIGVGVSGLTKQLGDYFGIADGKGLLINNVVENSPAARAGLKAGDIIVEVEGKAIGNSMELIRAISEKKEGEVVLTILRNRNRQTVKVTPEKMKVEDGLPFKITGEAGGRVQFQSAPLVRSASPARITASPVHVREIQRIL